MRCCFAVLSAVEQADTAGQNLSSEELADVFPWEDDMQRLNEIDGLCSHGYLMGRLYRGSHPDFHEWEGLRLEPMGHSELERVPVTRERFMATRPRW